MAGRSCKRERGRGFRRQSSLRLLLRLSAVTTFLLWCTGGAFVVGRLQLPLLRPEVFIRERRAARAAGASVGDVGDEAKQVLGLLSTQPDAVWYWNKFLCEQGKPAGTQIADVPIGTVQEFLVAHAAGSFGKIELAEPLALDKLELLRRTPGDACWHWEKYCLSKAYGVKNPRRLPDQVVAEFLESYAAGKFEKVEMAGDEMVQKVSKIRKGGGNKIWQQFCKDEGLDASSDPRQVSVEAVDRFIKKNTGVLVEFEDKEKNKLAWNSGAGPKVRLRKATADLLKRDLTTEDIGYVVKPEDGPGPYTATVVFSGDVGRMLGEETVSSYIGQSCGKKVEAENSAAEEALKAEIGRAHV